MLLPWYHIKAFQMASNATPGMDEPEDLDDTQTPQAES